MKDMYGFAQKKQLSMLKFITVGLKSNIFVELTSDTSSMKPLY